MRNRRGYSLVELLVSTVLILFILVLMAEVLRAVLGSFRLLKATGDLQERLLGAIPGAALGVYPETGHALHWEQPEQFAEDLQTFLQARPLERA